jgi:hypothetical protein
MKIITRIRLTVSASRLIIYENLDLRLSWWHLTILRLTILLTVYAGRVLISLLLLSDLLNHIWVNLSGEDLSQQLLSLRQVLKCLQGVSYVRGCSWGTLRWLINRKIYESLGQRLRGLLRGLLPTAIAEGRWLHGD